MNEDLELAIELAAQSDVLSLKHFRSALSVRNKADLTPVTEVDEAIERMIRDRLTSERPDDGLVGEEFGSSGGSSRRWIIDPIDATKNFIRGIPVFATLIALEAEGQIIAGVVSAPALGSRWWASRGEGAFRNGDRLAVSTVNSLAEAQLCYDGIHDFDVHGSADRFLALVRACGRSRAFGDFWSHMLVAEGAAEIAIEPKVALWDMAAIQIIVEEAGGRFTGVRGESGPGNGSGLSTNGLLHQAVVERFQ